MTGTPCQQKIERALTSLPGMYSAVVCLDRGYADVEFGEDRLTGDEVIRTIKQAGYQAKVGG